MNVKLLTEHHLEFLSLKGGCTGSSESTLVKMPHCWKSFRISFYNKVYVAGTLWKCPRDASIEHHIICFLRKTRK